jgi:hypothetical protein
VTFALQQIRAIDRGRCNADADVSRSEFRPRHVTDLQNIFTAGPLDDNCFHVSSPLQ